MIQSKWRVMVSLFPLVIITTSIIGSGCAARPSGIDLTYRRTAGNAIIHQSPQAQAGSSVTSMKDTFNLNNFRIGLFGTSVFSGESGGGAAFLEASGFSGGEFDVSYRRPFPIISNRLYVCPGILLGIAYMEQNLLEPYMGKTKASAVAWEGRGIGGLELYLAKKVSVSLEASWSQSQTLDKWTVEEEGDTPSVSKEISVPDEFLRYSGMNIGGYELGATLRIGF